MSSIFDMNFRDIVNNMKNDIEQEKMASSSQHLQSKLDQKLTDICSVITKLSESVSSLTSQNDKLTEKLSAMSCQNDKLCDKIVLLTHQNDKLTDKITELVSKTNNMERVLNDMRNITQQSSFGYPSYVSNNRQW